MADLVKEIENQAKKLPKSKLGMLIGKLEKQYRHLDEVSSAEQEKKTSRWEKLAEDIRRDSDRNTPEFQQTWSQMKQNMQTCREEIEFPVS